MAIDVEDRGSDRDGPVELHALCEGARVGVVLRPALNFHSPIQSRLESLAAIRDGIGELIVQLGGVP